MLVVRDASGEMLRLPLGPTPIVIGRSPEAAVQLDHQQVSRKHAEFWRDESSGQYHVRDLKSRNGTIVNGQHIAETTLVSTDQVAIGPFILTIDDPAPESTGSTIVVMADGPDHRISTLREWAAPRIDV